MSNGDTIDTAPPVNSLSNQGTGGAVKKNIFARLSSRKTDGPKGEQTAFKKSLREGMTCGAVLFLVFAAWMAVRSNDTAQHLQSLIPVKSASIELSENSADMGAPVDPNAPKTDLARTKNINALPAAPIEGLFEENDGRMLPMSRISDEMTPFQAYKKPFTPAAGKSLISIVIVDYGLSPALSASILDNLPPEISLVLTPYAPEATKWAASARAYGHEFWLSLPMQTTSFGLDDTGPETLLLNSSPEENQKRVFSVMGTVPGYAGLVSQQDHAFTPTSTQVQPVMKQVFGRGLAFVESNPAIPAFGLSMAMEFGYPYAQNGAWLDADLRPDAVDKALQDLELQATRKGKAIAFLHPYPLVINKVQGWIKDAEGRGIQMAPLSAMVQ